MHHIVNDTDMQEKSDFEGVENFVENPSENKVLTQNGTRTVWGFWKKTPHDVLCKMTKGVGF